MLIWCRRVAEDVDAPFRVRLILLTTQTTPMTQPRPFAKWRDGDKIIADKRLPKVARDSEEQGNYWRPGFAGFANADYKITGYLLQSFARRFGRSPFAIDNQSGSVWVTD